MYLIADTSKPWNQSKQGVGQDLQTIQRLVTQLQQQVQDLTAQVTALQATTPTSTRIAPSGQVIVSGGIQVAVNGALSGNGTTALPLSVVPDGVTIQIVGNQLTMAASTYFLGGNGVAGGRSAGPSWITPTGETPGNGPIHLQLNGGALGTTMTLRGRVRATSGSVQLRLYNVSTSSGVGSSSAVTSTTWADVPAFSVTIAAGINVYELNLLPSVANADVFGVGFLGG